MPDDSPVDVLLLDVMGTLVYDPFYVEMPAFFGMSLERLLAEKDPTAWLEFEQADIDEATMFERFFSDRRAIDGPGLKAVATEHYRLLPGIEELLTELSRRGVAMHALSNYPHWYREIEERTRLSRFLEWSFVSWDTRLRKPDPEAYLHAARKLGVEPEQCLFVDDKERNTEVAQELGMRAHVFSSELDLRTNLTEMGLLL